MWSLVVVNAGLVTGMVTVLAAVEDALIERGILGIATLILGTFAWKTIQAQAKKLEAAEERERTLLKETYEKTLPVIARITDVADTRTAVDHQLTELLRANIEVLTDVRRQMESGPR